MSHLDIWNLTDEEIQKLQDDYVGVTSGPEEHARKTKKWIRENEHLIRMQMRRNLKKRELKKLQEKERLKILKAKQNEMKEIENNSNNEMNENGSENEPDQEFKKASILNRFHVDLSEIIDKKYDESLLLPNNNKRRNRRQLDIHKKNKAEELKKNEMNQLFKEINEFINKEIDSTDYKIEIYDKMKKIWKNWNTNEIDWYLIHLIGIKMVELTNLSKKCGFQK